MSDINFSGVQHRPVFIHEEDGIVFAYIYDSPVQKSKIVPSHTLIILLCCSTSAKGGTLNAFVKFV